MPSLLVSLGRGPLVVVSSVADRSQLFDSGPLYVIVTPKIIMLRNSTRQLNFVGHCDSWWRIHLLHFQQLGQDLELA